jgi:hypothetical protein
MQVGSFGADVSGLSIGPFFKGQPVQEEASPLKTGQICSSETSVLNQPTLCNIPSGRAQRKPATWHDQA